MVSQLRRRFPGVDVVLELPASPGEMQGRDAAIQAAEVGIGLHRVFEGLRGGFTVRVTMVRDGAPIEIVLEGGEHHGLRLWTTSCPVVTCKPTLLDETPRSRLARGTVT